MARGMGLQEALEGQLRANRQDAKSYSIEVYKTVQKYIKENAEAASAVARGIKAIAEHLDWGKLTYAETEAVKEVLLAAGYVAKHGRMR